MEPGEYVWIRAEVKSASSDKVKAWIQTPWGWKQLVIVDARDVKPDTG